MIQTCNDDYWRGMEKLMPAEGPCGKTYDDVDHSTVCPHAELPLAGPTIPVQAICQTEHVGGGMGTRVRTRTR